MEKGLVVKADNDKITIRMAATEACKKCGCCSIKDDKAFIENLDNSIEAQVGDAVFIENKPSNTLTAASIIYLLPIVLLIGGYFLSLLLVKLLRLDEKFAVLGAIILFALSFPLISVIDKQLAKKNTFKPVIHKKI